MHERLGLVEAAEEEDGGGDEAEEVGELVDLKVVGHGGRRVRALAVVVCKDERRTSRRVIPADTALMANDLDEGAQVRDVLTRLRSPIPDLPTLLALLCGPLDAIGTLPPKYLRYNTTPVPSHAFSVPRHIPPIQRAILEHIEPTWSGTLSENDCSPLIDQYLCPDLFASATSSAGDVTLSAYSTILSTPFTAYSVHILARLSNAYPLDRLHSAVFGSNSVLGKRMIAWEDCMRNICSVPAKVANAAAASKGALELLEVLEQATYFNNLSLRAEALVYNLGSRSRTSQGSYFCSELRYNSELI